MFHQTARVVGFLATALCVGTAQSQLSTKPFLYDWGQIEQYASHLLRVWEKPSNVVWFKDWEEITEKRGKVPVGCTADYDDWLIPFASADMVVYDVLYKDCDQVFQLCLHKDAMDTVTPAIMIENWGLIPVGMRQYAGDVVILPKTTQNPNSTAHQNHVQVAFAEDYFTPTVWVHELSHSMDRIKAGGNRWSETQAHKDAVENDTHLVTVYGRSDHVEAFAETGILAAYDIATEGGLPAVEPNWGRVENQLHFAVDKFGTDLMLGVMQCMNKVAGTPPMPKSDKPGKTGSSIADGLQREVPTKPYPQRLG